MKKVIQEFPKQFSYEPVIENAEGFKPKKRFIVAGMGGSALAPDLIHIIKPELALLVHRDYGLPKISKEDLENSTLIASSYSGNTEETISAFKEAAEKNMHTIAIATGGTLLEYAKKNALPYIHIPNTGIQPRSALGYSFKAILHALGEREMLTTARDLEYSLDSSAVEPAGKELAEKINGAIPVIYTSLRNKGIAYNWKIKFNETGKIPAFFNVFPELNHNEMTGFDTTETIPNAGKFYFIFIKDPSDDPRILKRMEVLEGLLKKREFVVEMIELRGKTPLEKIFNSLLLADWASYHTALRSNRDPEQVPMIEEFKKNIS